MTKSHHCLYCMSISYIKLDIAGVYKDPMEYIPEHSAFF